MEPTTAKPILNRTEDKKRLEISADIVTSREKYLYTNISQISWGVHARAWDFRLRLTEQTFPSPGTIVTKFDFWFWRENISKSIKWEPATKIVFLNSRGDPIGESPEYDHDFRGCYRGEIPMRDRKLKDNYFDLISAFDLNPPAITFIGCGDDD